MTLESFEVTKRPRRRWPSGRESLDHGDRSTYGWRRTRARFAKKPVSVAAAAVVVVLIGLAILAPLIAPYDLGQTTGAYMASPSRDYWLGTNPVGYDTFSQLLFGLRTSMLAAGTAMVLGTSAGTLVGLVSGFFGGRIDRLLMRLMEAIMVIPDLIIAVVILGILGPSIRNAMIGIAIGMTPGFSRLVRGQVLRIRAEPFVEAAKVAGARAPRTIRTHLFPNILPFLVVQSCMSFGFALLAEGGLAFLGLSAQPPEISLGSLLRAGFSSIHLTPRLILLPGLVITTLCLSFNLIADGLRDSLAKHDASDAAGGGR